jgi:transcriptional regulator with XRE-family HTH domain
MDSLELRKALETAGMTVAEAAKRFGLGQRTLYRYLSGEVEIPRVVALAVLCMVEHQEAK